MRDRAESQLLIMLDFVTKPSDQGYKHKQVGQGGLGHLPLLAALSFKQ